MRAAASGARGAVMVAGEYVEGVIAGRQFAIREWQVRKEKRADDVLFNRLRARKWQREHPERRAEIQATYYAQPGVPAKMLARQRAARRKANAKAPEVFTCAAPDCGAQWCKAPWIRGKRPTFCGPSCYQRTRYDTHDNRIENLEVMTHVEHANHHVRKHPDEKPCTVCGRLFTPHPTKRERAKTCSRKCFGAQNAERPHLAKLTPDGVRAIRALHAGGARVSAIARAHGVHRDTIGLIVRGKTWKHVS